MTACIIASENVLLAQYRTNQQMAFHQTLVDDVDEATDELIRFRRSSGQGQGHTKVRHLSELLYRSEASR